MFAAGGQASIYGSGESRNFGDRYSAFTATNALASTPTVPDGANPPRYRPAHGPPRRSRPATTTVASAIGSSLDQQEDIRVNLAGHVFSVTGPLFAGLSKILDVPSVLVAYQPGWAGQTAYCLTLC